MDTTKSTEMSFREAWFQMLNGKKIKRPLWAGYWAWENGTIMMHCWNGKIIDIRQTDNVAYTFDNVACRDWMVVEEKPKLMPCPFCGKPATALTYVREEAYVTSSRKGFIVASCDCGCRFRKEACSEEEFEEAWNRRAKG